jgi:hypothetical protein
MKLAPVLFLTFLLMACNKPVHYDEKKLYKTYEVGTIAGLADFRMMDEEEQRADSTRRNRRKELENQFDSTGAPLDYSRDMAKADYRNNRCRAWMVYSRNGKTDTLNDPESREYLPVTCLGVVQRDTIFVNMAMGLLGGAGIEVKLFDDKFEVQYFEWADGESLYKYNLNDTAKYGTIMTGVKYQQLVLQQKPHFKPGEPITGYFTFTSSDYYEGSPETGYQAVSAIGKVYFTCVPYVKE